MRLAPDLLLELDVVERGEPGLAQPRGEDGEGTTAPLCARCAERRERLGLDCMGSRRLLERLDLHLTRGQRSGLALRALRICIDPGGIQRLRATPESLEGFGHTRVCIRVVTTIDAQVPFDPSLQRRMREVAASHERDAEVVRLEAPRLWMKRPRRRRKCADLDNPRLEAPRPRRLRLVVADLDLVHRPRRTGLLPVQELLERPGLRDLEVVAGDEPHAGSAPKSSPERGIDAAHAALLDERSNDRHIGRSVEQRHDVPREGIGHSARRQRTRNRRGHVVSLAGDDVSHAAAWVGDVTAVPGDDVQMQVHHGLPRRGPGVEADVVAVGARLGAIEIPLHLVDQGQDRAALVFGSREPVRHEAPRDDKRVARRDRVRVADGERELVRGDPRRGRQVEERRHRLRVSH